jgi:hypothetical protein
MERAQLSHRRDPSSQQCDTYATRAHPGLYPASYQSIAKEQTGGICALLDLDELGGARGGRGGADKSARNLIAENAKSRLGRSESAQNGFRRDLRATVMLSAAVAAAA